MEKALAVLGEVNKLGYLGSYDVRVWEDGHWHSPAGSGNQIDYCCNSIIAVWDGEEYKYRHTERYETH